MMTNHNSEKLLKDHLDFPKDVESPIENMQYEELLQFTNFSLCKLMNFEHLLDVILETNNEMIIKHIINNILCINVIDDNERVLIHFLVQYLNNIDLVKYFIDKYHLDLESKWSKLETLSLKSTLSILRAG